ncbi:uncharacterized protein TNCV_4503851 [Trichonephila clavipes]|nr:uncharacterized protein TNCV_4503851 [Trichonephila clavipes]
MDSMKSHVSENVKNALKSASAKIAIIPGGLTKKLQPLDVGINRSFKSKVRKLWEQWMSDGEKNYTKTGKLKRASYENVSRWVLKAWNDVAETTVKNAFRKCECESDVEELKIIELRAKILTNDAYKEDLEFVKCMFEGIVSNRIDEENKQKEQTLREFELQKIRLQNETQRVVGPQTLPQTKIELKKLLPTFIPEVDNMDLFLPLFEWQIKLLDLGEDLWVPYLIGALPSDATSLIALEPEEKFRDYSHIRGMLLQRFKLTAENFRELFSRHRKSPNGAWKNYYFEIRANFEGWLNELKIDSFDGLKNLMIADQMRKRCSPECKELYLDIWEELISPEMLADKLEAFDNIRRSLPNGPSRHVKASETLNDGRQASFRKPERPSKREYSLQVPNERYPLRCYGCGKQGVIKSRCPTGNPNA